MILPTNETFQLRNICFNSNMYVFFLKLTSSYSNSHPFIHSSPSITFYFASFILHILLRSFVLLLHPLSSSFILLHLVHLLFHPLHPPSSSLHLSFVLYLISFIILYPLSFILHPSHPPSPLSLLHLLHLFHLLLLLTIIRNHFYWIDTEDWSFSGSYQTCLSK